VRFTVKRGPDAYRSELARSTVPMNSEWWYGFSIRLPETWVADPQSNILAQWHAVIGQKKSEGDGVRDFPVLSIHVQDKRWLLKLHWNTAGAASEGPGAGEKTYDLGEIRPGEWVDFVVDVRWAANATGFIRLWKGGRRLVDYSGPTEYDNKSGPYFKIGIYHPAWKRIMEGKTAKESPAKDAVVVYADAVRIARAPATYAKVAPAGAAALDER
jgi:hypothetical protein